MGFISRYFPIIFSFKQPDIQEISGINDELKKNLQLVMTLFLHSLQIGETQPSLSLKTGIVPEDLNKNKKNRKKLSKRIFFSNTIRLNTISNTNTRMTCFTWLTITSGPDNTEFTCRLFTDFSKAFDTVNHHILLEKLHKYGFNKTFDSNGRQFVKSC